MSKPEEITYLSYGARQYRLFRATNITLLTELNNRYYLNLSIMPKMGNQGMQAGGLSRRWCFHQRQNMQSRKYIDY